MTNLEIRTIKRVMGMASTCVEEIFVAYTSIPTRSLPVFLTDASTVSLSHGIKVFRSISSQEIPSYKMLQYGNYEITQETKGI